MNVMEIVDPLYGLRKGGINIGIKYLSSLIILYFRRAVFAQSMDLLI